MQQSTQIDKAECALDGAAILRQVQEQNSSKYPKNLQEKFPRIFDKVVARMGTKELDEYLKSLMLPDIREPQGKRHDGTMVDNKFHHRQGFPLEVASELMFLMSLNDTLVNQRK